MVRRNSFNPRGDTYIEAGLPSHRGDSSSSKGAMTIKACWILAASVVALVAGALPVSAQSISLKTHYGNNANDLAAGGGPQALVRMQVIAVLRDADGAPVDGVALQFDDPDNTGLIAIESSWVWSQNGSATTWISGAYSTGTPTLRVRWMTTGVNPPQVIASASTVIDLELDDCQTLNASPRNNRHCRPSVATSSGSPPLSSEPRSGAPSQVGRLPEE